MRREMGEHRRKTDGRRVFSAEFKRQAVQRILTGEKTRRKLRGGVEPEEAAKLAIARRAKPGAPLGHVRLVLTLELRRALAEQLNAVASALGRRPGEGGV